MATTNDTRSEAEGPDGEDGKAAPAKRKLSLKLIIMAVGGLVGLSAIGGGAYYFLFAGHGKAEAAAVAEAPPVKPVVFLDMPDVLVNLSASNGSECTQ
jgi:flagellar FliL protein